jgi:general secretion pathway protein L
MREPITIDFGAPARVGDLPAMAGQFLTWWGSQLRDLLPWQVAASPTRRQPTLYARPDRWFLRAAPDRPAAPLDIALSDTALAEQMLQMANGAPLSRLRLLLPRENVIVRRVDLPQMSAARMRQAVELQVDRLSPFKADDVRTAVRVAGFDHEKGQASVDVAIVPLTRVRPIEQRLRAIGLAPSVVDVEGESGDGQGFDFGVPPTPEELRRRRTLNLGLGFVALIVWFFAFYAWSDAGKREIERWEGRIAALRPEAERSAALRQQVEGTIAPVLRANEHQPDAVLSVLLELTRVLPDSARVLDLKLEGDAVSLSGLAANAPDLIGLLEKSPRFREVKFVSPVVRKSETGVERFEIAMKLEREVS